VRRAAANVSSTVTSTVSSVASIGSANRGNSSPTNGHLALNAKEKYTMTLKVSYNYIRRTDTHRSSSAVDVCDCINYGLC